MWYPVSDQGSKLDPPHWEHRVLATEPPGEYHFFFPKNTDFSQEFLPRSFRFLCILTEKAIKKILMGIFTKCILRFSLSV